MTNHEEFHETRNLNRYRVKAGCTKEGKVLALDMKHSRLIGHIVVGPYIHLVLSPVDDTATVLQAKTGGNQVGNFARYL